jgi:pimeloyl-ACP methyl ester carboxylesterase
LGYAEWGDPDGKPVLFFHGGAMSRLSSIGWSIVSSLGVRLLSVERPGHGLSDPKPGWRLLDWPDDVAAFADRLGVGRFAVVGMSAGGPPALACGYALPDRVTAVGMVATIVNPELYEPDEMSRLANSDLDAARRFARESFAGMAADVDAHVAAMADRPGPDGAVYSGTTVQASFRANRREAFRQGLDGPADDIVQMNRPWGFSFEEVTVPVHYWLGDQDHLTAVDVVRSCTGHLPNYSLTVYPGEGHAIGFTHGDEILAELAAALD